MEGQGRALTEVYFIINRLEDNLKSKIPNEVINGIKEKMDRSFIPDSSNISKEANAILSVVYSEYLCTDSEKKKWDEIDEIYKESIEKGKETNSTHQMQYDINKQNNDENKQMISIENETFFKKIIRIIKNFFKVIWRD